MTRAWVAAASLAALLLVPGYRTGVFHGVPHGAGGTVLFTIAIAAAFVFRRATISARFARAWTAAVVFLAVAHMALVILAPRPGWLSAQYRSDRFEGRPERSTEFSIPEATRVDREIHFADDFLPVYFLNEASFNRGIRREVTLPYSIRWTGHVQAAQLERRSVTLTVRGSATLEVDGETKLRASSAHAGARASAVGPIELSAGPHVLVVSYVKPADTDPLIDAIGLDGGGSSGMIVTPAPATGTGRRLAAVAQWVTPILDGLIGLAAAGLGWTLLFRSRSPAPARGGAAGVLARGLAYTMFALFITQGTIAARTHVARAESLSGGDDWLAYEARAREVAIHGPSMSFGYPRGKGEVFSYYPGYSYFLAAVHRLGGEDLFAPIFVNFVLLFGANLLVYATACRLFGPRNALISTAALVVIEELAFMRYYTVQLFSENLYFLTIALAIWFLVRFALAGRARDLAAAGLAAGASAIVRSAFMTYLPFAILAVAAASWQRGRSAASAAGHVAVFLAAWFGVVSLMTVRNYIVAGTPTLISDNLPLRSFVIYNLPDTPDADARYLKPYTGTLGSATRILFRIMVDHPYAFFRLVSIKVGFSLGLLQWMGQKFHPELFAPAIGYLVSLVLVPSARRVATWPIHGFVISHLAAMALSMPSNYGYRLILPMHLFFSMFAVALVERVALGEKSRVLAAV